jgi:WD40 repeat protein
MMHVTTHEAGEVYAVYHAVDGFAMIRPNVDQWLFNNGLHFSRVAVVQAPLNRVFAITNNTGEEPWVENPEVVWHETGPQRSTSVGDVIVGKTDAWLVMPMSMQKIAYPSVSPDIVYRGHTLVASPVAWSPDARHLASGDWDGYVRVWDRDTANDLFAYKHRTGPVSHIMWSPNGERLASCNVKGTILIRDGRSGEAVRSYEEGHPLPVYDIQWLQVGLQFLAGGEGGMIHLVDVASKSSLLAARVSSDETRCAALSPQGDLAAFADTAIEVWNIPVHARQLFYRAHISRMRLIAFSQDGKTVASVSAGDDLQIRIWDSHTGRNRALCVISSYSLENNKVHALAWSPDGKLVAAGMADGSVQLFDSATGRQVSSYHGHTVAVFSVSFSPDGAFIASASGDSTVHVWLVGR